MSDNFDLYRQAVFLADQGTNDGVRPFVSFLTTKGKTLSYVLWS